ncbi:MAG TPA: nickel pincer cofactor biosynthesis protein LarC [Kofleriaceae bacterium]|nr:nickel pincer cofactor biosynthesis protein LarC [Kofleriaceae bacterium]
MSGSEPGVRGRHLHVDCVSGAAGDMMLGALIDVGVPVEVIGDALDAIGAGRERLRVTRVVKHGIAAVDVKVDTRGELPGAPRHVHAEKTHAERTHRDHAHGDHTHSDHVHDGHTHAHHADPDPAGHADGDHAHYHYAGIRRRISDAKLTAGTQRRALDIFDRIARAEATLHGTTVDDVVFHEVGAIDALVDIVGTAAALDWLGPGSVSCASVAMGHGSLTCSHGVLPVPAPAALEVLREAGGVIADGGVARELCTPTGAAILAATVTRWTAAPTGRPIAVGWGAGDVELADRPNALRAVVLDAGPAPHTGQADHVWQIDANLDDMSPELCGPASDAVFAAGALDVWWTSITMKKGRPALMISALATGETRSAVAAAILRETTTIGVRYAVRERTVLARAIREVNTPYGAIPVKVATDGDRTMNAAPEFDACVAAARLHGVPVKRVFAAAQAAFEALR